MIKAKTNYGEATVSVYSGYKGACCVSFKLDIGGTFCGWSVESLKKHTYPVLLLDGSSDLRCTNILDVMASLS